MFPQHIKKILASHNILVPKGIQHISFYSAQCAEFSFKDFIIEKRIKPIQKLQLLALLVDKEFRVGYADLALIADQDEEDVVLKEIGPLLLSRSFSMDELSASILDRFGIEQIITQDHILESLYEEHGKEAGAYPCRLDAQGEFILCLDPFIVITDDDIFALHASELAPLLLQHDDDFKQILATDAVTITHDVYITRLLSWLPGMVNIRSLT